MRRVFSIALTSLVFAGLACGDGDPGVDTDAGNPGIDASDPNIDAGPPPIDAAPPADSRFPFDLGVWTWVDVPGAECMNDTTTGMMMNLGTEDKLVIYLEGGGACFNQITCAAVAHPNGFGEADGTAMAENYGNQGLFNRDDPDNPFADWSYVFLPYCTGDVFAGTNPDGFGGRNQVGYRNVTAYLELLAPEFSASSHVVLTGSSAGGFGAAFNYDQTQQAFGDVRVTLLDDSGPPLSDTYLTPCLQQQFRDAWGLTDALPADCTECTQVGGGGIGNLAGYYAKKYPDRRFGLISSLRDDTIRTFFGFGYPDCAGWPNPMPEADFEAAIVEVRDDILAPYSHFRAYTIDSNKHVWLLDDPLGSVDVNGETLTDWIRAMLDDQAAWDHVIP